MASSVLLPSISSSPWGQVPASAPQRVNLLTVMDEALALRIEHEDLLAIADPTPYLVLDQQMSSGELAVDVSSDFAVALALQLEEQAAAYSGMPAGALPQNSPAIDDSSPIHSHEVNTYEGSADEIQDELMHNARHRHKGQAKAYRKIRTKPVRPVHVVVFNRQGRR
ncbi:hypothetical protein AaE_006574 [Aphanomyces astaci]|uniref:Uncharacterized protein n=1 Tax=Aphanomyces astaci TaxID=112090 RepID=A0A6A5AD22_APHAT|nr:hypothetical protein AaE_006574 [Aphanomyces astaci]